MVQMENYRKLKQSAKIGYGFWFQWCFLTIVAFLLSLFLIEIGERNELSTMEGVMGGAIIGIAQFLVLRQRISHAWLWALSSIITWGLMTGSGLGAIGWVVPRTDILAIRLVYGALFGSICGVVLGMGQWLVLRNQVLSSGRWILISPLCWGIGLSLGWTMGGVLRSFTRLFLGDVIGLILTWVLVSVMTGAFLDKILKN
ncbi:MAG: hypothetical protein F6K10_42705 [Moorea sp. SIO2B7]|nr:hypothetical protein [Moorena sp. SIO2B7]